MSKVIVGIAGPKGAGKDTVAKMLSETFNVYVDRLAYPIKWAAENTLEEYPTDDRKLKEVFGLYKTSDRSIGKDLCRMFNVKTPTANKLGEVFVSELYKRGAVIGDMCFELDGDDEGCFYTSPRVFEQAFGAAARDVLGPDVFIEALHRRIVKQNKQVVVVPDIRMENEAEMCDFVIQVDAPWVTKDDEDVTEKGLPDKFFDCHIMNNTDKQSITKEVAVDFFYTHVVPKVDLGYE